MSAEQYDLNAVQLAGVVIKIWGRGDDIFARLRLSKRGLLIESDEAQSATLTLVFSGGKVCGQPISLQDGDLLRISGHFRHSDYAETLRNFVEAAHAADSFWKMVPPEDLDFWRAITFKRVNAVVVVRRLAWLDAEGNVIASDGGALDTKVESRIDADRLPKKGVNNRVVVEGVVSRRWEHRRRDTGEADLFVRLAVYDRFTHVQDKSQGNFGRVRRKPHYITVRFSGGTTPTGRSVEVKQKDRMRVTGMVGDRGYAVTLHEALLQTGDTQIVEAMQRLPNTDKLETIVIQQEQVHVEAGSVVVYSRYASRLAEANITVAD